MDPPTATQVIAMATMITAEATALATLDQIATVAVAKMTTHTDLGTSPRGPTAHQTTTTPMEAPHVETRTPPTHMAALEQPTMTPTVRPRTPRQVHMVQAMTTTPLLPMAVPAAMTMIRPPTDLETLLHRTHTVTTTSRMAQPRTQLLQIPMDQALMIHQTPMGAPDVVTMTTRMAVQTNMAMTPTLAQVTPRLASSCE